MPAVRIANLAEAAEAAGLSLAGLGGTARLTQSEVDLLARGDAVTVKDATVKRLADALGLRQVDITVRGGAANDAPANDAGDADHGYADSFDAGPSAEGEPVYAPDAPQEPRRGARRAEEAPDDVPPFERAMNEALMTGEGRYTEEDRDLVVAALSAAELPSSVGARELPLLVREWLDGAIGLRGARDNVPGLLLERLSVEGGRTAQRMASRALEKLQRPAPAATPKKGKR